MFTVFRIEKFMYEAAKDINCSDCTIHEDTFLLVEVMAAQLIIWQKRTG
jgi:hypothetical protein